MLKARLKVQFTLVTSFGYLQCDYFDLRLATLTDGN